jgi:hypothetical protein
MNNRLIKVVHEPATLIFNISFIEIQCGELNETCIIIPQKSFINNLSRIDYSHRRNMLRMVDIIANQPGDASRTAAANMVGGKSVKQ